MSANRTVGIFPMHGRHKWIREGYRTRDAHMTQWFTELADPNIDFSVFTRPDPWPLEQIRSFRASNIGDLARTRYYSPSVFRYPNPGKIKKWWVKSVHHYRIPSVQNASIVWNPMLGLRPDLLDRLGPIHLDLLDDWTVHRGFQCIWSEAEEAYERLFSVAHSVSANSEGTLALAERFGRGDALLLPNGVDPERFSSVPLAQGPITVGYVGKIGRRLDSNLIATTIKAFPSVKFVFAGPVLERGYVDEVAKLPNVHMLGDVHYSSVPDLLSTFDIGWVPHDVENGQVGGDAIKIYEYRASGLPVVTTPIIGTRERPIDGVRVVNAIEQLDCLKELVSGVERVPREPMTIPPSMTWENKAQRILNSLMLND